MEPMEGDPASGGAPVEGGMRDVDCDGPVVGLEAQIPTDRCGGALAIRESEVERVASAVCGGSADEGPQATVKDKPEELNLPRNPSTLYMRKDQDMGTSSRTTPASGMRLSAPSIRQGAPAAP